MTVDMLDMSRVRTLDEVRAARPKIITPEERSVVLPSSSPRSGELPKDVCGWCDNKIRMKYVERDGHRYHLGCAEELDQLNGHVRKAGQG